MAIRARAPTQQRTLINLLLFSQPVRDGVSDLSNLESVTFHGRTIWIGDAHRDDGKRFVVHADEKLTAFLELEVVVLFHSTVLLPAKLADEPPCHDAQQRTGER